MKLARTDVVIVRIEIYCPRNRRAPVHRYVYIFRPVDSYSGLLLKFTLSC